MGQTTIMIIIVDDNIIIIENEIRSTGHSIHNNRMIPTGDTKTNYKISYKFRVL